MIVPDDARRRAEVFEDDAFFLGMVGFFDTGRHFLIGTPIDDIDRLCTQTLCGSGCVHRDVTAADDRNGLASRNRCIITVVIGLHQVCAGQKLIGGIYAV